MLGTNCGGDMFACSLMIGVQVLTTSCHLGMVAHYSFHVEDGQKSLRNFMKFKYVKLKARSIQLASRLVNQKKSTEVNIRFFENTWDKKLILAYVHHGLFEKNL